MRILTVILINATLMSNAQTSSPKVATEILELYYRVESIHGNLYFDTAFKNYDTTKLRMLVPGSCWQNISSLFHTFNFKPVNFNSKSLIGGLDRVVSIDSFQRLKKVKLIYTPYETGYNIKLDSIYQWIDKGGSDRINGQGDSKAIQSLLMESSYWKKASEVLEKADKKLFNINSIFEAERYYLIFYSISEIHGYLHSDYKCDLVIK